MARPAQKSKYTFCEHSEYFLLKRFVSIDAAYCFLQKWLKTGL